MSIPSCFIRALEVAHPSWHAVLCAGLDAVEQASPGYLAQLANDTYLPTQGRIFAAFSLPLEAVQFVLVGEGPYPRAESATGYCFMDGAVHSLWSDEVGGGLSKPVNRATSLRNFIKMLLVAEGRLDVGNTSGAAMAEVVQRLRFANSTCISTMQDLQINFLQHGFLMLNAALVFRSDVAPRIDAKAWHPFLMCVFAALNQSGRCRVILWGKLAEHLQCLSRYSHLHLFQSEHPYNLSFIANPVMQDLFRPLKLLSSSIKP